MGCGYKYCQYHSVMHCVPCKLSWKCIILLSRYCEELDRQQCFRDMLFIPQNEKLLECSKKQQTVQILESIPQNVTYRRWYKWSSSLQMSPVKRICVFEHSVMTNFNCACPDIQRGQGSGFLSEGSSWLTACMSEQQRFWRDCADAQARLNLRCSHRR